MSLGICQRSGDIIEPMLKPQWYVSCAEMAKRSTDAVRNKELEIIPAFHEATWFRWLDNIQDWCISRQLWWGHRIPAYFATSEKAAGSFNYDSKDLPAAEKQWVVERSEALARTKVPTYLPTLTTYLPTRSCDY
jgi:valyl-tRNA synthetase